MTSQTPQYKNYLSELNQANKIKKKSEGVKYKEMFTAQLKEAGLSHLFESEIRFHHQRKWRFDFASRMENIAIELQGGGWGNVVECHKCHSKVMRRLKDGQYRPVREGGRHQNPKSLQNEYEKLNEAQRLGWRVFLLSPEMVRAKVGIDLILSLISPGSLETKA